MFEFFAGTSAGILLVLLLGHLERRRVSRRQRELARLQECVTRAAWQVDDAIAKDADSDTRTVLSDRRNAAADAYYAALRGDQ